MNDWDMKITRRSVGGIYAKQHSRDIISAKREFASIK